MATLGKGLDEKIIHHDLDSVYTSYRWLEAILLGDEMRVSFPESGAKGNQGDPRSPGSQMLGIEILGISDSPARGMPPVGIVFTDLRSVGTHSRISKIGRTHRD